MARPIAAIAAKILRDMPGAILPADWARGSRPSPRGSGKRVVWNLGTELDAQAAQEVDVLLHTTLTADGAVKAMTLDEIRRGLPKGGPR